MRILITGGSGVVGWALAKHFIKLGHEIHFTYHSHPVQLSGAAGYELDLSRIAGIQTLVDRVKPQVVFHCAALTNVDLCETDHALADAHNITATEAFANACGAMDAKLVYISTSYVYGASAEPIGEDTPYHPTAYYGYTKAEGEKAVRKAAPNHLIMRIDQPYGWVEPHQKKNTVVRIVEALEAGKKVREVVDWINSPTYIPDIGRISQALLERNHTGTYNSTGPDFISRYEWGLKIAKAFRLDEKLIEPFNSAELKLPAKRLNVHLLVDKVERDAGIRPSTIDEGLAEMVRTRPKK